MTTQEKLVDIINGFTENENLVESSWCDKHKDGLHGRLEVGQQHYIIKQLTALIDSAKREELIWIKEYVDEMHDEPLIYALQKRLAQLEQSEEGE